MTVTVCKLGGSLLSLPDLDQRLTRLVDSLADHHTLIVVGGGDAADVVREWDRQHQLPPERAHWLALQAMTLNEALVCELLPDSRLVSSRREAEQAWNDGDSAILCACRFLRAEEETCEHRLPHTWDVTSDSVAAWIAIRWPADRLVLLKSVPLPATRPSVSKARGNGDVLVHTQAASSHDTSGDTSSENSVDRYFDRLVPQLARVDWVNLRSDEFAIQTYYRKP